MKPAANKGTPAPNGPDQPKIGLVTYSGLRSLTSDEQALARALANLNVQATAVAWDDAPANWHTCDGLVLRSAWNYHERPQAFRAWLDEVEQTGTPLWNTPSTVRWNMEKTYLQDLAAGGLAVTPTVWVAAGETAVLSAILAKQGWEEAVVKPVISASAYATWQTCRATAAADQPRFAAMQAQMAVMVQQKMPIEQGEWSLVFLGGELSHAVLKRPQPGDFRVQQEYGGDATLLPPPEWLAAQAGQVLRAAPACLYARVDGVAVNGRLVLMELELIEPALFLHLAAGSAQRFAHLIAEKLKTINGQQTTPSV